MFYLLLLINESFSSLKQTSLDPGYLASLTFPLMSFDLGDKLKTAAVLGTYQRHEHYYLRFTGVPPHPGSSI